MRTRTPLFAAVAAAALAAGCGKDTCPTAAANAKSHSCSAPAAQQVAVQLQLCETCAHTAPTCTPDLHAVSSGSIFLDTRWEICSDNSSCAAQACSNVTCQFSVPDGSYTVGLLDQAGNPTSFTLTVSGGAPTCG
jgi:hypothetical protein